MDPLLAEARVQANRLASRRGCEARIYEARRDGVRVMFVRTRAEGEPRYPEDVIDEPATLIERVGVVS